MDCDWLIIGSGFGGSVSALRLTEKGYRVVMLEKGRRLEAKDFPKTNWNLKRWLWMPQLGWRGLFKMTFFRHVTVLSGVGVGGGSLVYANTLPIPKDPFFLRGDWSRLADWKQELAPFYEKAQQMLGATVNLSPTEDIWPLSTLKGTGSTLTSFVYANSPTGDLNQPEKAYAAAVVLRVMVLILNLAVDVVHRRARQVGTWSS